MSVTIRPCVGKDNIWEVDIRVLLPDGTKLRERREAPVPGKSAALRWAQDRERVLVRDGKPKREQVHKDVPTLKDFAPRFIDGHVRANRHKPSGVAGNESIIRRHLVRRLGSKRLNEITTEDVQQLKAALTRNSPKTVNNVLTVLNVMLRTAVEWNVIDRPSCTIKLVRTTKSEATFHDFDAFERLVQSAQETDRVASVVVLLGGEAGLRCGEMMALEWGDVDLGKRQLCVARSDWKGHVTDTKGGRVRYVPLTTRLATALSQGRHLRSKRVLSDSKGQPLTQKEVQVIVRRVARRAQVKPGVHILRHTFGAPARAIQELAGHQDLMTTQRYMHLSPAALDAAIRLLEAGTALATRGAHEEAAGTGGQNSRTY